MSILFKFRVALASILASVGGLYMCLLGVVLIMKGATREVEVDPTIYFGVAAAIVLVTTGYAIIGRIREAAPIVLAYVAVGALAQPLVVAASWSHSHAYWILAVGLAAVPYVIFALCGLAYRKLMRAPDSQSAV
jgi:hypothetical protein